MVDFQMLVDGLDAMTCVVSVEALEDGSCGEIRIVTGNKPYILSIEQPGGGYQMLTNKFEPNSIYTKYFTRDLNFEDFCYRSAVQKKCLHSYVKPDRIPAWFNMTFMPVARVDGNIHYCTYTMEMSFEASSERMSNVSGELASAVLETCIKLRGTNDFQATMDDVIKDLQGLCKADHCCVFLVDTLERRCSVLCEAFGANSKLLPMETYVDDKFYEIAESWEETISGSNCLVVKNEHDMEVVRERNPVWYESLTNAGVYNIILFPLKNHDQLLGYIWAINYDPESAPKIKEMFELTTFILGSEIGNHLLLERLQILSSKDMLTGVNNRNEMNNLVDKMSHGQNEKKGVGVIFADLNGLKTVNDEMGHSAGDRLLKDAAKALNDVFDQDCIYRAGGDEFTVILRGVSAEELDAKVAKLRAYSSKYPNLSFAIGRHMEEDEKDIRTALRLADQNMYADKRKFYEEHPERTRRLQ